MIKRVFKTDPLLCDCGGTFRILSFITEPTVIAKIVHWGGPHWYIGGDPWTDPEGYRERSPLTHVQNVTTPTLLLHGEVDTVDTIEQTMNFHNALWEKGTPTRFIRFPREGHGIREPRHLRVRMVNEIAWMQKYIHGIEWMHPERVTEETPTTENP